MNNIRTVKILTTLLILTAFFVGAEKAKGWIVSTPKWDLSGSSTVYFRANQLPTNYQNRLYNARDTWNAVSGASIFLSRNDSSYGLRVYDGYIDGTGNVLGQTWRYGGEFISSAKIKIDYDENWNETTGATSAGDHDLMGVLTHELGHALAIKHTNAACTSTSGPTMCPTQATGTDHWRSLMTDDANALRYLYP